MLTLLILAAFALGWAVCAIGHRQRQKPREVE